MFLALGTVCFCSNQYKNDMILDNITVLLLDLDLTTTQYSKRFYFILLSFKSVVLS